MTTKGKPFYIVIWSLIQRSVVFGFTNFFVGVSRASVVIVFIFVYKKQVAQTFADLVQFYHGFQFYNATTCHTTYKLPPSPRGLSPINVKSMTIFHSLNV